MEDGYIRGPQLIGEATETERPRQAEDRETAEEKAQCECTANSLEL